MTHDSMNVYANNALNQMIGYEEIVDASSPSHSTNNITYAYDANGNLANKTETGAGSQASATAYTYDEDNRLVEVGNGIEATHTFAYDYRSHRRNLPRPGIPYPVGKTVLSRPPSPPSICELKAWAAWSTPSSTPKIRNFQLQTTNFKLLLSRMPTTTTAVM